MFQGLSHKILENTATFFKEAFNMACKLNSSGMLVSSLLLTFEILTLKNGNNRGSKTLLA
jgi:hypothetical protein